MQLSERAMLVDLSIGVWNPVREDKERAGEIAAKYGADGKMGKYQRYLIDPDALKPILKKRGEIRNRHYELTLPWGDDSSRIITSAGFFRYRDEMREKIDNELDPLFREFWNDYPAHVRNAQQLLNGLWRPDEYPDEYGVRRKCYARLKVKPLPESDDFRVNLGASEVQAIRDQIEADAKQAISDAMAVTSERVRETIGHLAERLKAYSVSDKGVANPFRDSLVGNVRELVDALPGLNVAGDPRIDRLIADMKAQLTPHDADTLRTNDTTRENVAKAADDILKRLEQYGL